jgi:hypothetical protein
MRTPDSTARSPVAPRSLFVGVLILIILTALPRPARAQFSQLGAVLDLATIGVLGTDVGYDEANDMYLFVGGHGAIFATCTNAIGQVTKPLFDVMNNPAFFGHYPRAEYSPDSGGFLVTWHQNDSGSANAIHGRIVSCLYGPTTPDMAISNWFEDGGSRYTIGAPIAYSRSSHVFLVAWQSGFNGISGRFVSASGVPLGGGTMLFANTGGARDPGLAWNPATNEFGLSYTGWDGVGAFAAFRRVRAPDGALGPLQKFWYGKGTYNTDITVNSSTGAYVMGWVADVSGATSLFAHFDFAGNLLNSGPMTTRFGGTDNFSLAFNPASGTILAVGSDNFSFEVAAMELNGGGVPISSAGGITQGTTSPGSFYPRVASRQFVPHWGLSFSRRFNTLGAQFVASGGSAPVAPPPPPPSQPSPAPAPAPAPTGGCTTPDPFVSLGGGVCVNGGWLPPGSAPAPAPAPAPPPTGGGGGGTSCTGSDPFASIGGGHCVNGGWVPGPAPGGGTTTGGSTGGSTGGCTGTDPFVSIGGGHCENGGWLPGPPLCSGAPDPFVSIGGGVCINGGWVPKGRP